MNIQKKTLFFKSQNGWSRCPYISDPRREKFDAAVDKAAIYALSPTDHCDLVLNEVGADINRAADPVHIRQIARVIMKHKKAFSHADKPIGGYKAFEASIDTVEGKQISVAQYKVPERFETALTEEIDKLSKMGVIVPCKQNYGFNTPIGAVPKSDGRIRLILNFRITLNKILANDDVFSIPDLEKEAMLPRRMKYFFSADIQSGYWNIKVKPADQHKLAIQWRGRNWMFTRLPFGLKSSGAIFCRAISAALYDMPNRDSVKVFVDDLLVYSDDFDIFVKTVDETLRRIGDAGFVVNPKKTTALYDQVKWLGRLVDYNGSRADPSNVEAVLAIKPPSTYRGLQQLLGMLNWCRSYIAVKPGEPVAEESFSHLAKPITALLKSNSPRGKSNWSIEADQALQKLKSKLASTKQNFSATERECLGVTWAVVDCRNLLRGCSFTVKCDHRA